MNICYVFKYYSFNDSGLGKYIRDISDECGKNNTVYVLTQKSSKQYNSKFVKLFTLNPISLPKLFNRRLIRILIHNIQVSRYLFKIHKLSPLDIIEFPNWEIEGLLFSLLNLIVNRKIKIVYRLHTGTFDCDSNNNYLSLGSKIIHYLESFNAKLPNVFLTTSTHEHKKKYNHLYNLNNKYIHIIPLGITIPRDIHLDSSQTMNIVYIGRMETRKGISTLLQSIPYILNKYPKAIYYLIGKQEIDIFSLIHHYIPVELLTRIRYQGFIDSEHRKNYFIKNSSICIFPSKYESFGYSIIEAMSFGIPVIACKTGGIVEIIKNMENGLLINVDDVKQLEYSTELLINNIKLRRLLGFNARKTIYEKYNISIMGKNTLDYYNKLINTKKDQYDKNP